jgi:small-conductance mechanosensitive channel
VQSKYLSIILLSIICFSSYADNISFFERKISRWDKILIKVENNIRKNTINFDAESLSQEKLSIRQIRDAAAEEGYTAKELLGSRSILLNSLGEENSLTQESAQIKEKRDNLKQEIEIIDSRVKSYALIQSKAQEILNNIDKLQTQKYKSRLLQKGSALYKVHLFQLVHTDILSWVKAKSYPKYHIIVLLIFTLSALSILSRNFIYKLNHTLNHHIRLKDTMINNIAFLSATIGSLMMILVKFNIFNSLNFQNLQFFVLSVFSIITSLGIYKISNSFHLKSLKQLEDDDEAIDTKGKDYVWLVNLLIATIKYGSLVITLLAFIGFSELSSYLSLNIFISLLCIALTISAINIFNYLGKKFSSNREKTIFPPLMISLMEPFIALIFIIISLSFWGITPSEIYRSFDEYSKGIPVGNITINPLNFLFAIALLLFVISITKIIQWFVSDRVLLYANIDRGIKDTVNALIGYAGVILAFMSALGTLGVSMSSMAIIAGALSVGIGFGLQAVVSNFISGLILLFERPIKVGDWVIVGDKEGIVKKIRVRSTEIETFQYASIMVPNSQFITESVTNLTLNNVIGRVDIFVGVKYGSDVDKVKKLLTEVVSSHPQIRKKPEPQILLQSFGDSSLDFEVRGFLKDISHIKWAASEIRVEIYKAFIKNNIEIPFPQRDINIKQS